MQHRPPFGQIDGLAREQGGAAPLDVARPRQGQGGLEPGLRPALLGQVQVQTCGVQRQPRQSVRVGGELILDAGLRVPTGGGLQFSPGDMRHLGLP